MGHDSDVLSAVRSYLGRQITFPSVVRAAATDQNDWVTINVVLPALALAENMQTDAAAGPTFAWAMAYWHERATGRPTRVMLTITGEAPEEGTSLRHWRRSQLILQEYCELLGSRFECIQPSSWKWPPNPVLNEPGDRGEASPIGRREHDVEVALTTSKEALESFRANVDDLVAFHRQLPVGLFTGCKSKETAWTPGNKSQVDLWGSSSDGKVFHLFELKAEDNACVGIIPEGVYYARLLHHVRCGLPDGTQIAGSGAGLDAVRRAEKIVAWLIAPTYHPLVYPLGTDGSPAGVALDSPLEWINQATVPQGLEFRILPYSRMPDAQVSWRHELLWPWS